MYISRIVIRNFRNFSHLDISVGPKATCIVGENNTGKTNLLTALRLVLDANMSSQYRKLIEHDIHSGIDIATPQQVIIAIEFTGFRDHENECALVGTWQVREDVSRLCFRFRPRTDVREGIERQERQPTGLTLEDYHWEMVGGGDNDPAEVQWNENLGTSIRFSDLQNFQVVFLPALRDVQQDLRQSRVSPLGRLFSVSEITEEEKELLVETLKGANDEVAQADIIQAAGNDIQTAFSATAGEAYDMSIRLGMADPSFASISRSLTVLLSNDALDDFEPTRNGLGLNNILYISMLLKYFEKRVANPKTAGQLFLVEEPEAHLHPQLQRVLYKSLQSRQFQTFLTTHSTHISSHAPLASLVVLTNVGTAATYSAVPAKGDAISAPEVADLERYLDATRSTLLFARKVILVEGPAELFLLPSLIKQVLDIDLDRMGITLVPIFGVHFGAYAKLFSAQGLPKKCAIIADGDINPANVQEGVDEDEMPAIPEFDRLANDYVNVFRCQTTFERALVSVGTLKMLAAAADECGAKGTARKLRNGHAALIDGKLSGEKQGELLSSLRTSVLNMSIRYGKSRFAQIASKHGALATELPDYIRNAINWLTQE